MPDAMAPPTTHSKASFLAMRALLSLVIGGRSIHDAYQSSPGGLVLRERWARKTLAWKTLPRKGLPHRSGGPWPFAPAVLVVTYC